MNKLINKFIIKLLKYKSKKLIERFDKNCQNANSISQNLLLKIICENKNTEYGKRYHFDKIKTIEDYKKYVPVSFFDDYHSYIYRMIEKKEQNLLTKKIPVQFAITSGSMGIPRKIPVSKESLKIYEEYTFLKDFRIAEEYYASKNSDIPFGKSMMTFDIKYNKTPCNVLLGALSSAVLHKSKFILPYLVTSPNELIFMKEQTDTKYLKLLFALAEPDVINMSSIYTNVLVDLMNYLEENKNLFVEDIKTGKINDVIKLSPKLRKKLESKLKSNPARAEELRIEFEKGFDTPIVPRIWKNLKWIHSVGTSGFSIYTENLKRYVGTNIPIDYNFYGASEATIATARELNDDSFTLIPESGFYEFIPTDAEDDKITYTIDQLEVGKEYEILITNLSGLYRYKIKDVVEVAGYYHEAPKLKFKYRKQQLINIKGEETNEWMLAQAVSEFENKYNIKVSEYSVYADTKEEIGKYILLIETMQRISRSKCKEYQEFIEEKLCSVNSEYSVLVQNSEIGHLEICFIQPHTYSLYREYQATRGSSPNLLKPIRAIDTPIKEKFFFGLKETDFDE